MSAEERLSRVVSAQRSSDCERAVEVAAGLELICICFELTATAAAAAGDLIPPSSTAEASGAEAAEARSDVAVACAGGAVSEALAPVRAVRGAFSL